MWEDDYFDEIFEPFIWENKKKIGGQYEIK